MSALLDAALARARAGEPVLPIWWTDHQGTCACPKGASCPSAGKHPLTVHGLDDASADENVVRACWKKWPTANLAVRTDLRPRLDVDLLEAATALREDKTLALQTEVVETPGGGLHATFAVSEPVPTKALRLDDGRALGDLKGARAYVLVPPSRIGDLVYRAVSAPEIAPMAVDDPLRWIAEVLPEFGFCLSENGAGNSRDYEAVGEVIPEGQRHNALTSYAGRLWVEGMSGETLMALLQVVNQHQCLPLLPEDEVREIAGHFIRGRQQGRFHANGPADEEEKRSTPGWRADVTYGPGHGLYRGNKRVLPEALVPVEILESDGSPVGAFARVHFVQREAREVFMPAEAVTSRDPAAVLYESTGIAWTPEDAKRVRQWLGDVLARAPAVRRSRALTKPHWEGDRPLLPGGDLRLLPARSASWLAAYGQVADVDEGAARGAWQQVLDKATPHPRLLMVLGAGAFSIYLEPLKRPSFIMHISGDSRRGKTLGERTAMAAYGNPDLLVRTWNTTRIAVIERLAIANILPVALDETATAGMKDELMEAIVFGAVTGVGRSRAARGGGLRGEQGWHLTILSTGERRLTSTSGLTGAQARIVQIQAPLTPAAEVIDEIHELAQGHYGWPLAWLREQDDAYLDLLRADLGAAEEVLIPLATISVTRTLARHLACCVAGARALSYWCRADLALLDVLDAAKGVLREVESGIEDEGASAADRLLDAVFEAEARRDWAFPQRGKVSLDGRKVELEGQQIEGALAVFPTALRRIAKEIGLADCDAALRELRDRGDLQPANDGKHLARVIRTGSGTARAYVLSRPEREVDVER